HPLPRREAADSPGVRDAPLARAARGGRDGPARAGPLHRRQRRRPPDAGALPEGHRRQEVRGGRRRDERPDPAVALRLLSRDRAGRRDALRAGPRDRRRRGPDLRVGRFPGEGPRAGPGRAGRPARRDERRRVWLRDGLQLQHATAGRRSARGRQPVHDRAPPGDVRGPGGGGDTPMSQTFQGSFVAMVTPFRNGQVDEAKLRELVELHVANGTDGLIPCGTNGESPSLNHDEHRRVVEIVIEAAHGRIRVVAGTGSNSTTEAIDLTKHAERAGAAGALVVNPYYNKPTQEGLYRHFRAVAESVAIPILVYNIQSRTAVNVETDTLARLVRDVRNIVGVKEASGSLDQMSQVIAACGPDFSVLSGDDNVTLPLLAIGGSGVVSVIANIVPRETADLVHAALDGDWKRARDLHYRLFPLARAAFLETNPIPIKEAMAMAGMLEPEFRLPMCRMSDANREKLRAILKSYALVK